MPERPDLRAIAENIQEALADYDRDALLEMLTYVFKEYVIESPPPVLISQVDGIEGLAGMSFAQLIETLQNRLDHPELDLFRVSDDQVLVRAGGALAPLDASARPTLPTEMPGSPGGERATAAEAERRGRGDLAGGRRGVNQAPPPRGVSISGRPTGAAAASAPAAGAAPAPAAAESSDKPDEPDETPEPAEGDDDSAVRFSLLELD